MVNARRRIAQLEKESRPPVTLEFRPNFEFRVAGMRRADVIRETMRRLRAAIDNPRASESQRDEWSLNLEKLDRVLAREIEIDLASPNRERQTNHLTAK